MSADDAWKSRAPEPTPCASGVHRYDHAARTCRCGAETVAPPQARGMRRQVSQRKRPYGGFNAVRMG